MAPFCRRGPCDAENPAHAQGPTPPTRRTWPSARHRATWHSACPHRAAAKREELILNKLLLNSPGGLWSWQRAVGRGVESSEHFPERGQGSCQLSPWELRVTGSVNGPVPGPLDSAHGKVAGEGDGLRAASAPETGGDLTLAFQSRMVGRPRRLSRDACSVSSLPGDLLLGSCCYFSKTLKT